MHIIMIRVTSHDMRNVGEDKKGKISKEKHQGKQTAQLNWLRGYHGHVGIFEIESEVVRPVKLGERIHIADCAAELKLLVRRGIAED